MLDLLAKSPGIKCLKQVFWSSCINTTEKDMQVIASLVISLFSVTWFSEDQLTKPAAGGSVGPTPKPSAATKSASPGFYDLVHLLSWACPWWWWSLQVGQPSDLCAWVYCSRVLTPQSLSCLAPSKMLQIECCPRFYPFTKIPMFYLNFFSFLTFLRLSWSWMVKIYQIFQVWRRKLLIGRNFPWSINKGNARKHPRNRRGLWNT